MSRSSLAAALTLAVVVCITNPAFAQQNQSAVQAESASFSSSIVTATPTQISGEEAWLKSDLEAIQQRVRRRRIALIATSATLLTGIVLLGVGVARCNPIYYEERECSTVGDVLLTVSAVLSTTGLVGALTSGIMLRNSNRKKREIERELGRIEYGRRLQWDASSGALVF